MKNYYSFDIETYKKVDDHYIPILDTNEFIIGAIMDKNKKIMYDFSPKDMYNRMINIMEDHLMNKERCCFYAHNTEYDFYGIFKNEMKHLINTGQLNIICTRPFIAIYKKRCYILDTMSFFPMALSDIGDMLGYKKLETPPKIKSVNELYTYLYRDVEIIIEAIKNMKTIMNKLNFKPQKYITGPTLSMNCFLSFLSKHPLGGWIMSNGRFHYNDETLTFLRQSMRGGYNTAFQTGSFKDCTLVDINSAYWEGMSNMPFPDLLKERVLQSYDIKMMGVDNVLKFIGVTHCQMQVPKNINVGILGVRYKPSNKSMYQQYFPTNNEVITGHWTNEEITYAQSKGYKMIKIYKSIIWTQTLNHSPLKEYILKLWELRKQNKDDIMTSHFLKLLGNGLYGKFIQRKNKKDYKWIAREEVDKYTNEGWTVISASDDYCIYKEGEPYIPKYTSVILGVLITSKARLSLIKQMEQIPPEDLLYCDTDSIMFKNNHLNKISIGNELGQYKVEESGDAKILGEKKYYINKRVKLAGLFRREQNKDIIDNGGRIKVKRMIGFKKALHFNSFDKTGTFEEIEMEYKQEAKKDTILPEEIIEVEL